MKARGRSEGMDGSVDDRGLVDGLLIWGGYLRYTDVL